jgi:hypothetical protein
MYGATLYHQEMLFDRCLNIILCHHPHIWSYGTGNLLVAPNTPEIISKASERATEWRNESLNKQNENLSQVIGNSFGYFIRYSIECRKRIRNVSKLKQRCLDLVQTLIEHTNTLPLLPEIDINKASKDEVLRIYQMFPKIFAKVSSELDTPIIDVFWEKLVYDMYLQMFRYVDVPVPQLADLILNIKAVCRKGLFRYGNPFIKAFHLTDSIQTREIIIECNRRPRVTILREFMFDDIETISRRVIPPSFLYADDKKECVICLEKKDVLVWPCHTLHVTCTQCTIELLSLPVFCPLCRQSILYIYGKWYLNNDDDDNTWLFVLHHLWYEWHL